MLCKAGTEQTEPQKTSRVTRAHHRRRRNKPSEAIAHSPEAKQVDRSERTFAGGETSRSKRAHIRRRGERSFAGGETSRAKRAERSELAFAGSETSRAKRAYIRRRRNKPSEASARSSKRAHIRRRRNKPSKASAYSPEAKQGERCERTFATGEIRRAKRAQIR